MKAVRVVGLVVMYASLVTAPAAATVVTFDDLVGQAPVPDGYGGINWGGAWTYYGFDQPPYTPHSAPSRIYDVGSGEQQFTFVAPDQVFNGAWFSGVATTTVQFNLYNDGGLVASSGVLNTTATPTFLDSGYAGSVDVVGVFSNANDFFVMDDVTYNGTGPSPAPEPATLLLWGTTAAGLGLLRRRRRGRD